MGCGDVLNPVEVIGNAFDSAKDLIDEGIESIGDRTISPDLPEPPKPRDFEAEKRAAEATATQLANERRASRRRRVRSSSLETQSVSQRAASSLSTPTRDTLG